MTDRRGIDLSRERASAFKTRQTQCISEAAQTPSYVARLDGSAPYSSLTFSHLLLLLPPTRPPSPVNLPFYKSTDRPGRVSTARKLQPGKITPRSLTDIYVRSRRHHTKSRMLSYSMDSIAYNASRLLSSRLFTPNMLCIFNFSSQPTWPPFSPGAAASRPLPSLGTRLGGGKKKAAMSVDLKN